MPCAFIFCTSNIMMMYPNTTITIVKRYVQQERNKSSALLGRQLLLANQQFPSRLSTTWLRLYASSTSGNNNNNVFRSTRTSDDENSTRETSANTATAAITTKQATASLFQALSKIQQGRPTPQHVASATTTGSSTATTQQGATSTTTSSNGGTSNNSTAARIVRPITNKNHPISSTTPFASLSKLFPLTTNNRTSTTIMSPLHQNDHNRANNNYNKDHDKKHNLNNNLNKSDNESMDNIDQSRRLGQRQPSAIPLRTETSLFDVFKVPEAPKLQVDTDPTHERSPNAFPVESMKQYYEILEPIIMSQKFLKKHTSSPIPAFEAQPVLDWLKAEEPAIVTDIPTFQAAIRGEIPSDHPKMETRKRLFKELGDQHQRFCQHFNFNERQTHLAAQGLFVSISMCARYGKGLPAEVIWSKLKEGSFYQKECLQHLLYVSATFTSGSARSRRKRRSKYGHLAGIASILDVLDVDETTTNNSNTDDARQDTIDPIVDDESDLVDITDEIAIFHDLLYEPSEQSINVRVKLLVAQGKAKEAETLLDEHSKGAAELRLRAYTPVLRLFIELGDSSSALRLFRKMQTIPTVRLDGDAYMHLISGIAEKGQFQVTAEPIESTKELGYQNMSGPGLFDELIREMAKIVYEIPETSAKRLYNGIASGFPESGLSASVQTLPFTEKRAGDNDLFASRVRINPFKGICPRSGVKLQLIHLSDEEKKKLVEQVLVLARNEQFKYSTSFNGKDSDEHLRNFIKWLDQRQGRPFTILIDGANVGYFHQNFEDGRFSYHQVQFMMNYLERLGENPLIVLPKKYSYSSFNVSHGAPGYYHGARQTLTKEERDIRDMWVRFGKVFFVPSGNLDDFYWIVSSVSSQMVSRGDKDLTVPQGNTKGQWPGTRPVLVTNDQMRDHQMDLLDPFLFRRWFSNYIVHYNFAAFVDGVCTHPEIGFTPADFFSREIQSCQDQYGSTIWHFPIAGTDNEWFCCRIPVRPETRIKLKPDDA